MRFPANHVITPTAMTAKDKKPPSSVYLKRPTIAASRNNDIIHNDPRQCRTGFRPRHQVLVSALHKRNKKSDGENYQGKK